MGRVKEIMTKNVISLQEDTSIIEASKLMQTLEINHLIVCDKAGKQIGILSSKDILIKLTGLMSRDTLDMSTLNENTISDIMTGNSIIRVDQEQEITFACNLMLEHKIHSLIVKKNESDVGLLTSHDCLQHTTQRMKAIEKAKYF